MIEECDTKEGIVSLLTTGLAGFNLLVKLRHQAGYEFGEDLTKFYVLGRWCLDSCGNIDRTVCLLPQGKSFTTSVSPKEKFLEIPDVLTERELEDFLGQRSGPEGRIGYCNWPTNLPSATAVCAKCGKLWTLEDCHDYQVVEGKSLGYGVAVKTYREYHQRCVPKSSWRERLEDWLHRRIGHWN